MNQHQHQWMTTKNEGVIVKDCECGSHARMRVSVVSIAPVREETYEHNELTTQLVNVLSTSGRIEWRMNEEWE